jgi:hypothetical protein
VRAPCHEAHHSPPETPLRRRIEHHARGGIQAAPPHPPFLLPPGREPTTTSTTSTTITTTTTTTHARQWTQTAHLRYRADAYTALGSALHYLSILGSSEVGWHISLQDPSSHHRSSSPFCPAYRILRERPLAGFLRHGDPGRRQQAQVRVCLLPAPSALFPCLPTANWPAASAFRR